MGVLKGVRAKKREKKKTTYFQSLGMFCQVKNENFNSEMSPLKRAFLIMDTGGTGKFPPVTPPSI